MDKTIDQIIEGIKSGKTFTVSTSMYENYYTYRNGAFCSTFENGVVNESKEVTEEAVRKHISQALHNPNRYDAGFEEDYE